MSENTVAALMREQRLAARRKRRRRSTTRPGKGRWRAPDLVKRDFPATQINVKWYGDGTEIPTAEGKLHLDSVLDMGSRRVLGFALSEHHDAQLAYGALAMAVAVRGGQVPGVILHTDQGSEGGFNWSSQHLVIMEVFGGKTTRGDDRAQCGARGATTAVGCGSGVATSDAITGPAGALACGAAGVLAADHFGCDDGRGRGGHRCVVAGRGAVVPARWRNAADQSGRGRGSLLVVR